MYADDLVILSAAGLQQCLNRLEKYCQTLGLTVNMLKTKVMVFNKCGKLVIYYFIYRGSPLEVASEYLYLGILFT